MSNNSAAPETSTVHLRSSNDWPRWLALIRTKATQRLVWDNINPDLIQPAELVDPPPPASKNKAGEVVAITALTPTELEAFKIDRDDWKTSKKLFDRKREILNEIEDYVIRTTGNFWTSIEHADGLHAKLLALKARVAPTNYARELEALNRWERANQGAKSTRTEEWIAEWEAALTEAQMHKLPEAQGIRPTRQFLRAVEGIAPTFVAHWSNQIETIGVTKPNVIMADVIPNGFQIATIFRNQFRTNPRGQTGSFSSTFQNQPSPDESSRTTKHGSKDQPQTRCLDGSSSHSMDKCFYLHKNLRPEGWVMRSTSARKIFEGLKKNSVLKDQYHSAFDEIECFLNENKEKPVSTNRKKDGRQPAGIAFAGSPNSIPKASFASSSLDQYPLFESWIFDSGSGNHIANKADRFRQGSIQYLDTPEEIYCGDSMAMITAYGEVDCDVMTPSGKHFFRLTRVALIENFHVNIVSHKRIRMAGYHWDDISLEIQKGEQTICLMTEMFGQYVLNYQVAAAFPTSRNPRPIRDADAQGWHLRCGHLGKDALEKLISAAYGVRIRGQLTLECHSCLEAKAKQHVSRRTSNNRAPRPLWRISIDLFELTPSMTRMVRALVIQDEYTGEIWVYDLPNKNQDIVVGALRSFAQMAYTQWNLRICRIRRDNEQALGIQYHNWIDERGIQDEPTPVYTPELNPRGERSGGVIREKSLAMQLGSRFPAELWHEIWKAAAYLYNRSPRESNGWKSPIEFRNKWLRQSGRDVPEIQDTPDLSNLWAYGCRAYPLKEKIRAEKERVANKTRPRTHLGYLVGYEGSNIYRIWVPSKATVIRTRDVDFVENEFFDPQNETRPESDLTSFVLEEPSPEPLPSREAAEINSDEDSSVMDPSSQITTEELDNEEYLKDKEENREKGKNVPGDMVGNNKSIQIAEETLSSAPTVRRSGRQSKMSEKAMQNLKQSGNVYHSGNAVTFPVALANFATGVAHRLHRRNLPLEPRNWKEVLTHHFKEEFMEAATTEWDAIQHMGTIQKIHRSMAQLKPLPLMWVFKYKFDDHGFLQKFKARICVRGDLQPGNEKDTYAATLAAKSFRVLMALASRWNLKMKQLDAVNAFPNSDLDEEIYVELPPGFGEYGQVGRLLKALYGLRRSPLLWQKLLSSALSELGLCVVPDEPCLFVNDWLIVFFYVDDIVYMYRESHETQAVDFQKALTSRFKMRDLGNLQWFLGIRVTRDLISQRIWLSQESYIEEITRRFQLANLNGGPNTPISAKLIRNEQSADQATIHHYQQKVGSLNYAAVITRPDISKALSELSSYLQNPSKDHIAEANRCIQYLYGTKKLGIMFDGKRSYTKEFEIFTDASFGDESTTRYSSQGWVMSLYGGAIAWNASKQKTVTTSSTEAELLGLSFAAKEAMATMRLFAGLRFHLNERLIIFCDNKQTIRLVTQELQRLRTALRHVDIHQCWVRQEVQRGTFSIEYTSTANMTADGMTKILSRNKFNKFVSQLGLTQTP